MSDSVSLRDWSRVCQCQWRPPRQQITLTSFLPLLLIAPRPGTVQTPWVGRDWGVCMPVCVFYKFKLLSCLQMLLTCSHGGVCHSICGWCDVGFVDALTVNGRDDEGYADSGGMDGKPSSQTECVCCHKEDDKRSMMETGFADLRWLTWIKLFENQLYFREDLDVFSLMNIKLTHYMDRCHRDV